VKSVPRLAIGFALFAGGLTFLVYGISQAIENGSCGTNSYGNSVGPSCPSGMGPMILLMVVGTFVALIGAGIASVGSRDELAVRGGVGRFIVALTVAVIAGVVLGFVDVDSEDTRPGLEILVAVIAPLALFALPGVGRVAARATAPPVAFATPAAGTTTARAEDIATRLRQLDQLRDSGLLDETAYTERRNQILAEL